MYNRIGEGVGLPAGSRWPAASIQ